MSHSLRSIATDYTDTVARPRRRWRALAAGVALGALAMPLDPAVSRAVSSLTLGGDLKREMEFLQQFGAITSCLLIAITILLLDPAAKRILPRAVLALIASSAAAFTLKCLIGRPRPRLGEPFRFLGPWNTFDLTRTIRDGAAERTQTLTLHAWEFWRSGASDLWSLPSNHTSAAFALAAVLARLYPRLRPLVVPVAAAVGVCRVLFNAHYMSDVFIGAALGWTFAGLIMDASSKSPARAP